MTDTVSDLVVDRLLEVLREMTVANGYGFDWDVRSEESDARNELGASPSDSTKAVAYVLEEGGGLTFADNSFYTETLSVTVDVRKVHDPTDELEARKLRRKMIADVLRAVGQEASGADPFGGRCDVADASWEPAEPNSESEIGATITFTLAPVRYSLADPTSQVTA